MWSKRLQCISRQRKVASSHLRFIYLGANVSKMQLPDGHDVWTMSPKTYVKNSILVVERLLEEDGKGYVLKSNARNPFPQDTNQKLMWLRRWTAHWVQDTYNWLESCDGLWRLDESTFFWKHLFYHSIKHNLNSDILRQFTTFLLISRNTQTWETCLWLSEPRYRWESFSPECLLDRLLRGCWRGTPA